MVNTKKGANKSLFAIAPNVLAKTKNRRKRNDLCLADKLQVIELLESNKSEVCVANLLGNVSRSQVHAISVNRDKIRQHSTSGSFPLTAKRLKNQSHYPEIDEGVLKWFNMMRNPTHRLKPIPISRAHIQARAVIEARMRGIENFKASNGWFRNWRRRCSIQESMRLFGEAGDVDPKEMEPKIEELRQKLEALGFAARNIFNMDESGLFYRALPNRTYLSPVEGDRTKVRGSKSLKAKDRITMVLCVNATGIIVFF